MMPIGSYPQHLVRCFHDVGLDVLPRLAEGSSGHRSEHLSVSGQKKSSKGGRFFWCVAYFICFHICIICIYIYMCIYIGMVVAVKSTVECMYTLIYIYIYIIFLVCLVSSKAIQLSNDWGSDVDPYPDTSWYLRNSFSPNTCSFKMLEYGVGVIIPGVFSAQLLYIMIL